MTLFSIGIRDDGEVLAATTAPHQGDDCDGLVYKETDEKEHDVFLFFIKSWSQDEAVRDALEMFNTGEYVALDPMWQPGSVWPDVPDNKTETAQVLIIDSQHKPFITSVPTHGRVNPFIDHYGERITWAYMRLVTKKCMDKLERENERWRRYWQELKSKQSEVPIKREAVAEPTEAKQLSFDFG